MRPPTGTGDGDPDRGQAFTLEGFVASVIVLTAILLALQSVVLTPTTSGAVDQQVQQQLRTEANDILVSTAGNGTCRSSVSSCPAGGSRDLSYLLRYWNGTEETWAYATNSQVGYGQDEPFARNDTMFGSALNATFTKRGYNYNVIVEYRNASDPTKSNELRMVYRGVPSSTAITTTYTVTLFDNDTLTGVTGGSPDCTGDTLESLNTTQGTPGTQCYYPIPEVVRFGGNPSNPTAVETTDSPIYAVVEIRVVVW